MINDSVVNLFKLGNAVFVSSGVSTIVGYAAKSAVPTKVPFYFKKSKALVKGWQLFHQIAVPAGATALAGMTAHFAVKHTDEEIDKTVTSMNNLIAKARAERIANGEKAEAGETVDD
jgi:hypothetical protein